MKLNDLPVGILVFDLQARVIAQNKYCHGLLNGVNLMGKSLLDLDGVFEHEDKMPVPPGQCPIRHLIKTRRPFDNLTMILNGGSAGETRYLLLSASPSLFANGEFRHVVCSLRDVSDLKRAASGQDLPIQLNTVIEQVAESIIITNSTGIIQYVNARFEEMTGWSAADVKGLNFLAIGGQTSKLRFYKEAMDALLAGKTWRGVHTARRKNGSSYEEEMSISPVRDANAKLVNCIALCRDVSEKKQLEAVAEAVNMAQNVGYVFSGIRHELGNPINSIKTALSVLSNNIDQWPRGHVVEYLNRALTEVRRVEYLLKALRTFNMYENPKMQSVDLLFFIENLLKLIESDFAARGIRISTSLDTRSCKCNADPRALHQVFLNLLANAADALKGKSDANLFIGVSKLGKMIQIRIVDNGVGMDESQQKNFFKPFFTTKPSGTGLGLVIVKKMLAYMNGTITIKSEPEVGTEISLLLEATNG